MPSVTVKTIATVCCILSFAFMASCTQNPSKAPDVQGMAYVPSGKFVMGSLGEVEGQSKDYGDGAVGIDVGVDELPRHTAKLEKGFYMDRYEVTQAEYKKFVDSTGHRSPDNPTHPEDPYIWKKNTYPEGISENPVALVNYADALAYCKWNGKRLPAEEEWEKACRGDDGRRWPWGDTFEPTKANTRALELVRSSPVGGFPMDVSQYGVYDMAGNLREWTDSWYIPYPGTTLKRETFGEQFRVVRGGSWVHTHLPESRCAARGFVIPDMRHRSLGFRCAKDGP